MRAKAALLIVLTVPAALGAGLGALWAAAAWQPVRCAGRGRSHPRSPPRASTCTPTTRWARAHGGHEVTRSRAAHALLPDDAMDGEFESLIGEFDMRAGCPGRPLRVPASGSGFWANAMTANAVFRVIDGSGHDIAHDRPDRYRELVTAFLRDQVAPQPSVSVAGGVLR